MSVMYTRPSRPSKQSPEDRKRQEEARKRREKERARKRNQNAVRWLFSLANIVAIAFMVIPLFSIVGSFAAIGTGVVTVIVVVVSYQIVNKTISIHPFLGLLVSAGTVGIVVFVGYAVIHAVFPQTLPSVNIAPTTTTGTNIAKVDSIYQSQYAQNSTLIHPYQLGNRFFFHVNDSLGSRQFEIPQNHFMNFRERLWQNLGGKIDIDLAERLSTQTESLGEVLSEKGLEIASDTAVVLDGNVTTVNFQQIFPEKLVLRSVSMDEGLIVNHLEQLYTAPSFTPESTTIINGIPSNASELGQIKLDANEWEQWEGIHQAWNNVANDNGFTVSGHTAQEALNAFETSTNVVVVIAHSDGYSIFFPDGSSLSIEDLSSIQESIGKNKPMVTLFSCETARVDDNLASFAKQLVDLGAKAVVAPVSTIGARSSSNLLNSFLEASIQGLSPIESLQKAIQESNNTSLETWIGMLPDS